MSPLNRREFLKRAGLTVGGILASPYLTRGPRFPDFRPPVSLDKSTSILQQAEILGPVRERWGPTSRLFQTANPNQFLFNGSVAWENYRDASGIFREINLTAQPSNIPTYDLMVSELPYEPHFAFDGKRRIFPDRDDDSVFIDLPVTRFMNGKTFTQEKVNELVWRSVPFDVILRWENSRVKLNVVLRANPGFDNVQFDIDRIGISESQFSRFLTGLKLVDSSPNRRERDLDVSFSNDVLTLGFDLTGLQFPIILDPTITPQVGASLDDGIGSGLTAFAATFGEMRIGNDGTDPFDNFMRFTNVGITPGSTIDNANLIYNPNVSESGTVVRTDIFMNDVGNAVAPTTRAEMLALVRTAGIAWDAIPAWTIDVSENSPDFASDVQTVVDRLDWNENNAMQAIHDDGGSDSGAIRRADSFDSDSSNAPQIQIVFTTRRRKLFIA